MCTGRFQRRKNLGSGNGTVKGSGIDGEVNWSNYEITIREGLCKLQIPGIIKTVEGSEIRFEARRMAISDESQSSKWHVAGAFYFDTKSRKYLWLNLLLGIYEGEFDMNSAHAAYRVF